MTRRRRSPLSILLVEDESDVREMYAEYFRWRGHVVCEAADGSAAVALASEFRPDAIVMDLSLPRGDGVEAIVRLKQDPRTSHVPIVICTAYLPGERTMRALEAAGYQHYVTKPCLPEELLAAIRGVLRPSRAA
jgi:two-component system OmpR family response regulator